MRKVVVIGGGVIGSSTAFYLKRRGVDVTILEACSIAAGASGKAGGFLVSSNFSWRAWSVVIAMSARH